MILDFNGYFGKQFGIMCFLWSIGIYTFETNRRIRNKQTGTPIQDVVNIDV